MGAEEKKPGWRQRLRESLEARVRERITVPGLLFLTALVMTGFAAFASANNLLFLVLAAMLATLLVSGFVSRLGIAGLELDVQLPDDICARRPVRAKLRLRNEKRWMPSFSIRVKGMQGSVFTQPLYFPVVPGRQTLKEDLDVIFARRGVHGNDSFQFSSRFPFGFAERRLKVTMENEVLVYPALEGDPELEHLVRGVEGEAEARFRGRGHDFHRIRPYQPPESARHVDWRRTAHTGELMVREFAREEEPLVTVFLDQRGGTEDAEWFERAVEGAAYLSWRLSRRGARLRFRSQGFEALIPVEGDVYGILRFLALVQTRAQADPVRNLEEDSVCVVFSAKSETLAGLGWLGARVLDPHSLPRAGPASTTAAPNDAHSH